MVCLPLCLNLRWSVLLQAQVFPPLFCIALSVPAPFFFFMPSVPFAVPALVVTLCSPSLLWPSSTFLLPLWATLACSLYHEHLLLHCTRISAGKQRGPWTSGMPTAGRKQLLFLLSDILCHSIWPSILFLCGVHPIIDSLLSHQIVFKDLPVLGIVGSMVSQLCLGPWSLPLSAGTVKH